MVGFVLLDVYCKVILRKSTLFSTIAAKKQSGAQETLFAAVFMCCKLPIGELLLSFHYLFNCYFASSVGNGKVVKTWSEFSGINCIIGCGKYGFTGNVANLYVLNG